MPNPAVRGSELRLPQLALGTFLQIADVHGRVVHEGTWEGSLTVNWPAGWYAVRAQTSQGLQYNPLVVE